MSSFMIQSEQLNNINASEEKLQTVRDSFIVNINNPPLELEEDEILELTNKVNSAFKDTKLEEEESGQELIIPKPNITDIYREKGVIKTHKGRKLTYLTNWEDNMDKLDLSNLSMNDLGYLASIRGDELYNYLGLDTNVSLTPFRVQGLGFKDAAIYSFFITIALLVVLTLAAGDGLIGELQFLLIGFVVFFFIIWLFITWIF